MEPPSTESQADAAIQDLHPPSSSSTSAPLSKNAQKKLAKAARFAEQKKERRAFEKEKKKQKKRERAAQQKEDRFVTAICAAPAVVLEAKGFLKGSPATAHPGFADKLSDQRCVLLASLKRLTGELPARAVCIVALPNHCNNQVPVAVVVLVQASSPSTICMHYLYVVKDEKQRKEGLNSLHSN